MIIFTNYGGKFCFDLEAYHLESGSVIDALWFNAI